MIKSFFKKLQYHQDTIIIFFTWIFLALADSFWFTRVLNFIPFSGDLDIYNEIRRFFARQAPFYDFFPPFGLGALLVSCLGLLFTPKNLFFTMFMNHFISILFIGIEFYVIALLVFKNKRIALQISLWLVFFLYLFVDLFSYEGSFLQFMPRSYYISSYGFRVFKYFLPTLVLLIILGFIKMHHKKYFKDPKYKKFTLFLGFLAGFSLSWENDIGFAMAISLSLIFIIERGRSKLFLLEALVFVAIGLSSLFIIVSIFTQGHFFSWWNSYGRFMIKPHYSLQSFINNDTSKLFLEGLKYSNLFYFIFPCVLIFGALFFILKRGFSLKKGQRLEFYKYGAFSSNSYYLYICLFLSPFLGNLFSLMLSFDFSISLWGVPFTLFAIFWLFNHFILKQREKPLRLPFFLKFNYGRFFILIGGLLVIVSVQMQKSWVFSKEKGWVYSRALGGLIRKEWERSFTQLSVILQKNSFYAPFSSGLEPYLGVFNPMGVDSLSNILSQQQKQALFKRLQNASFDYVITLASPLFRFSNTSWSINRLNFFYDLSKWQIWISKENWGFYKFLFSCYDYTGQFGYLTLWRRKKQKELGSEELMLKKNLFMISLQKTDHHNEKIILIQDLLGKLGKPLLLDVEITYKIKKQSQFKWYEKTDISLRDEDFELYYRQFFKESSFSKNLKESFSKLSLSPYLSFPAKKKWTKMSVPLYINSNGKGKLFLKATKIEELEVRDIRIHHIFKCSKETLCDLNRFFVRNKNILKKDMI